MKKLFILLLLCSSVYLKPADYRTEDRLIDPADDFNVLTCEKDLVLSFYDQLGTKFTNSNSNKTIISVIIKQLKDFGIEELEKDEAVILMKFIKRVVYFPKRYFPIHTKSKQITDYFKKI